MNVQVVVESDEQQIRINSVIMGLKKSLDEISSKIDTAKLEFKEVKTSRKDKFLQYFDKVS